MTSGVIEEPEADGVGNVQFGRSALSFIRGLWGRSSVWESVAFAMRRSWVRVPSSPVDVSYAERWI